MSILNFSYLKGFVRSYPFFVPFFSFFYGILFQNNLSIYFSLLLPLTKGVYPQQHGSVTLVPNTLVAN